MQFASDQPIVTHEGGSGFGHSRVAVVKERPRILLVDDSASMRQLVVFCLKRLGPVEVEEAADGIEGLKMASLHHYDLIITDINMPLLDGLRFIAKVRQRPGGRGIPFIVITAEGKPEDRQLALDLGAAGHIAKPIKAGEVLETVRGVLAGAPIQ